LNKYSAILFLPIILIVLTACQPVIVPASPDVSHINRTSEPAQECSATQTPVATEDDLLLPMPESSPDNSDGSEDDSVGPIYEMTDEDNTAIDTLIRQFTDCATKKDTLSMLNMFAVDEYIKGYDTKLAAKDLGLNPDDERAQPPSSVERINEVDSSISLYFVGFFMDDMDLETVTTDDFLAGFAALDCTTLSVLRIDELAMDEDTREQIEALNQKRANRFGAEAMDYRTMLLNLDNQTYYCGATLIKYDDNWKFYELTCGPLILSNPNRITNPMSASEYEELLKQ